MYYVRSTNVTKRVRILVYKVHLLKNPTNRQINKPTNKTELKIDVFTDWTWTDKELYVFFKYKVAQAVLK